MHSDYVKKAVCTKRMPASIYSDKSHAREGVMPARRHSGGQEGAAICLICSCLALLCCMWPRNSLLVRCVFVAQIYNTDTDEWTDGHPIPVTGDHMSLRSHNGELLHHTRHTTLSAIIVHPHPM